MTFIDFLLWFGAVSFLLWLNYQLCKMAQREKVARHSLWFESTAAARGSK